MTDNQGKWGNYEIYKHGFKTDKDESFTAQISIRLPPSLKEDLTQIDGWKDDVRKFIFDYVEKKKKD